tara:strand:+ start:549 stop:1118 length:570 start_codon:yes stop_codon:yes gene_type:complete
MNNINKTSQYNNNNTSRTRNNNSLVFKILVSVSIIILLFAIGYIIYLYFFKIPKEEEKSEIDLTLKKYRKGKLSPQEASNLIKQFKFDYIIDIRSKKDYTKGHWRSAKNIPYDNLDEIIYKGSGYRTNLNYLIYSDKTSKAKKAYNNMKKKGYLNVNYLDGYYYCLYDNNNNKDCNKFSKLIKDKNNKL